MIPSNEGLQVPLVGLASTTATAFHRMSFDTKNSDSLNLYVMIGSHDSDTQGITEITISEDDTVTSASSQTGIVSLSSGTQTSATFGNVLPIAALMDKGGVVNEIQIDLKKRKRFIGVEIKSAAVAAGMAVCVLARLTRNAESRDSATQKAGIDLADTNVSGCMQVLQG